MHERAFPEQLVLDRDQALIDLDRLDFVPGQLFLAGIELLVIQRQGAKIYALAALS